MKLHGRTVSFLLLLVQIQIANMENLEVSNEICILKSAYLQQTNNLFCINSIKNLNNIKTLLFQNSKLLVLLEDTFRFYTEATEIYLNSSGICEIQPNAFAKNCKLQRLYLNDNTIVKLNSGCFNFLEHLKILDISKNNLRIISVGSFDDLKNLEVLNLSNNNLIKVSYLQFNFVENLRVLDLSHNSLMEVNPLLLLKFVKLQRLLINNNRMKRLTLRSYKNCTDLKLLDISFNQLVYINTPDYTEMNINNNLFKTELHIGSIVTHISNNNFIGFAITSSQSQFFNASWNKIEHLNSNNFNKAQDLKVIDLSHNLITNIAFNTFNTLQRLTNLNLSYNLLRELEFGTFDSLISLETLDLSYNKFKFLYKAPHENVFNFCIFNQLHVVNLNGNPWANDILNKINPAQCVQSDLKTLTTLVPRLIDYKNDSNQIINFLVLKQDDFNKTLSNYFENEISKLNFAQYYRQINDIKEDNFYILICSGLMMFTLFIVVILLFIIVCRENKHFIV